MYKELYDYFMFNGISHSKSFDYDELDKAQNFANEMWNRIKQEDRLWLIDILKSEMTKELNINDFINAAHLYSDTTFSLELFIVGHCDLNCHGCLVGAPLVNPWFADINELDKTLNTYSKICNGELPRFVHIMGGEPFLHPDICRIVSIVRQYLPTTSIVIVTNGKILRNINKKTLKNLSKNKCGIDVSIYGPNTNFIAARFTQKEVFSKSCESCILHWPVIIQNHSAIVYSRMALVANGDMFYCTKAYLYSMLKPMLCSDSYSLRYGIDGDVINIHNVNKKQLLEFLNKKICPLSKKCLPNNCTFRWNLQKTNISTYIKK